MNAVTTAIAGVPATVAYLILAAALLAEGILLIGAFVPTMTLMLSAGALARAGQLNLPIVLAVAAVSVVISDYFSVRAGRMLGPRLRDAGIGRRIPASAWLRAERLMNRRGGQAMFIARFIPVLRTLVPYLAGATELPYRRIGPYSALAAVSWACLEAGSGYAAADVLQRVLTVGGPLGISILAVVVVAIWGARRLKRRSHAKVEAARTQAELEAALDR